MKVKKLLAGALAVTMCLQGTTSVIFAEDLIINDKWENIYLNDRPDDKIIIETPAGGQAIQTYIPIDAFSTSETPTYDSVTTFQAGLSVNNVKEVIVNNNIGTDIVSGGGHEAALVVSNSDVTVNGNIKTQVINILDVEPLLGTPGAYSNYGNAGIKANNANIKVYGDVSSELEGIISVDSNIMIKGNVESTKPSTNHKGMHIEDGNVVKLDNKNGRYKDAKGLAPATISVQDSTVTVNGNVSNAQGDGIYATGAKTEVTVVGNVVDTDSATLESGQYRGDAVVALHGASVEIGEGISSDGNGITAMDDGTNVKVTENVFAQNGYAIIANDAASVSVQGAVTGYNNVGIRAGNSASVSAGSVCAKDEAVIADNATVIVKNNVESMTENAIDADHNANVTVLSGNVSSGMSGIVAKNGAEVTVKKGDVQAVMNGVVATNATVHVVNVESDSIGIQANSGAYVETSGNVSGDTIAILAGNAGTIVTVGGDVKSNKDGILTADGASALVTGDITSKGTAIQSRGEKASVINLTGTVTSTEGVGVIADNKATVIVADIEAKKDAIEADHGASIAVLNNITSEEDAIEAKNGSNVVVGGDVSAAITGIKADGKDTSVSASAEVYGGVTGVSATNDAKVEVETVSSDGIGVNASDGAKVKAGSVTSKDTGVKINQDGNVAVEGDVTAKTEGVKVEIDGTTAEGCVLIEGTVTSDGNAFVIEDTTNSLDAGVFLENIPEIIVFEAICDENEDFVKIDGAFTAEEADNLAEEVATSKIEYIIHSDAKNGTITLTTATYKHGVYVANEGAITISIVPDAGYEVKSVTGGKATVTRLSDGSYEVTIPRGGGVDIFALCEAIVNHEDPGKVDPGKVDPGKVDPGNENSDSGNNSGNNTIHKNDKTNDSFQIELIKEKKDTKTEYICVADAKDKNEGVKQLPAGERRVGLSAEQLAEVKAVDAKNIEPTGLDTEGYVYGRSIRVEVEDAPKTVTLYANADNIEMATVLYLDVEKDEWSEIETVIDPVTGLIDFEAPAGDGIVALLVK